jgi:hypothetical protein
MEQIRLQRGPRSRPKCAACPHRNGPCQHARERREGNSWQNELQICFISCQFGILQIAPPHLATVRITEPYRCDHAHSGYIKSRRIIYHFTWLAVMSIEAPLSCRSGRSAI